MIAVTSATGLSRMALDPAELGPQLELLRDDQWSAVSLPAPLVSGLGLGTSERAEIVDGVLELAGSLVGGGWRASVRAVSGTEWFRVRFELDAGAATSIPEILLDLGALPAYERGNHVWFKTVVENPPQWNHEARGNGFPAAYYFDPVAKTEYSLFVDLTTAEWMGRDSAARFLDYRCGIRRSFDGAPRLEFGMLATAPDPRRAPREALVLDWYVSVMHRSDTPMSPSEQEALVTLVDRCAPLLRPSGDQWPDRALSWSEVSDGLAADLMTEDLVWNQGGEQENLLAYVGGRSDAWTAALEARGLQYVGSGPCLDSALWILRPLDAVLAAFPGSPWRTLRDRVDAFARRELLKPDCVILNGRATSPREVGTWQYVYLLADAWYIYSARGDEEITARILDEVDRVLVPFAETVQHVFPLTFDKASLRKYGPGANIGTAGTYALFLLDLARVTGRSSYREQAERALRVLANVPLDDALQEVFFTAHALEAADLLHVLTGDVEWRGRRDYFRAQTLRMMYWFDDRTSPALATVDHLGMFEACLSINYPAAFENLEVLARLATSLPRDRDPATTLRVLDYGRRNNLSFFPVVSPDVWGPMPLQFIPFEELPLMDGIVDAGFLGQEIYGSGWTFRAWLLWEAYAVADDREIMVVNTDSYREGASGSLGFFLYNGTTREIASTVRFAFPIGEVRDGSGAPITAISGALPVRLGAGQWVRIEVARDE